jgi:hypothetical protein
VVSDSECLGYGDFKHKWLVSVVLRPLVVFVIVWLMFAHKKLKHQPNAKQEMLGNIFFALFLCYPSFCQVCMASLQCTPSLSANANDNGEFTVLLVNDRVSCENLDHDLIQMLSGIGIILVGFGAPLFCACFLKLKYRQSMDFNEETNSLIAHQLALEGGADEAKLLVRDINVSQCFSVLFPVRFAPCFYI